MKKEAKEEPIKQIEISKNKWLYTTDNFGKLEKDMVFESKTYQSGIKETEMVNFKIITIKQAMSSKKKKNLE